jgi:hypothetical protein
MTWQERKAMKNAATITVLLPILTLLTGSLVRDAFHHYNLGRDLDLRIFLREGVDTRSLRVGGRGVTLTIVIVTECCTLVQLSVLAQTYLPLRAFAACRTSRRVEKRKRGRPRPPTHSRTDRSANVVA